MAQAEAKEQPVATKEIERTSLAVRGKGPDEVTVQFRRWTAHGQTAYQKGQYAGFPIGVALQLESRGAVMIDPGYRRGTATERMVQKA